MEKGIYDILNRVDTNFEEYKEIKLSDYENKINSKRILAKINRRQDKYNMRSWGTLKKIAVASMIAVICMTFATTISFASEGRLFNYLYTFFNGSGITQEYDEQTGVGKVTIEMNATENPPVKLDGGKLYFIADGSETDITKQISNRVPYIGEYMDEQNVIHKFIIGGEPVEECYGYEENLFDGNGMFIGASGYYGSKVEGIGSDDEPEWLVAGRNKIGRDGY
ncbi:hypothetical protein EDD66_1108 [Mobilisporobacter senegalensis]|uniref:DUF4179 domain-containing protein n=1 Tax=Mobilisporobacter senegalensis TaxID=1329262 RepID=A0A3N1XHT3_9FIRM|nr:hypothetical protein [Mobilisporobacter senegalensis]ROR25658.1 hypothetical protein EDD66_1108 [Mobilisporobacter senegalensis]